MKRLLCFCFYILLLAERGNAQSESPFTAGIVVDQDIFLEAVGIPNEDRNYTMGFGAFVSMSKWAKSPFVAPARWLSKLRCKPGKDEETENAIFQLGMTGFTPRYLGENIADSLYYMIYDRPFSSLMFFSAKHQIINERKVITNQVAIGILGLHIGKAVQHHIHDRGWFGSTRELPYGWKYQISNNFEPTILLSNKVDYLVNFWNNPGSTKHPVLAQAIFSRELRLGYYTGGSASASLKIGLLDRERWASYDAYQLGSGNKIIKIPEALKAAGYASGLKCELYLLASIRPNLVLYNAMLMGQLKDNFHELSFGEIRKVVTEGFAGVGATLAFCNGRHAVNILGYVSGRTPEHNLALKRSHYWGGIQLSYSCL